MILMTNGTILSALLACSAFALKALKQATELPEENTESILKRYESLAGYTNTVISACLLASVVIISVLNLRSQGGNHAEQLLLLISIAFFFTAQHVSARELKAYNKYNFKIYSRLQKNWKITSWIELIIALKIFISIVSPQQQTDILFNWIEPVGAVIIATVFFIFNIIKIKEDLIGLLDKPVQEIEIFNVLSAISDNLDKICEFKGISARRSGSKTIFDISIVMPNDYTVGEVQEVEDNLKQSIKEIEPGAITRFYVTACSKDCIYGRQCPLKKAKEKNDIPEKEE